jgi:OPA family glycerol-3-phosphate transporter-like MFS transporter 1/2
MDFLRLLKFSRPVKYGIAVIGGEVMPVEKAGNFYILFDVRALFGGIVAGCISDRYEAPAKIAAGFMSVGIPSILLYQNFGRVLQLVNSTLMVIAGFLIGGSITLYHNCSLC